MRTEPLGHVRRLLGAAIGTESFGGHLRAFLKTQFPVTNIRITATDVTARTEVYSLLQCREQGTDLVVDLIGAVDGGGDFLAKQQGIPAAEAMHRNPDGALGTPEPPGDRRVGSRIGATGQNSLQFLECRRPPGVVVLAPEPVEDPDQQGQRPAPIEDSLRGLVVGRLANVSALCITGVD